MSTINELNQCTFCSQLKATASQQCVHCLSFYCTQCLIKHHHYAVKEEFLDLIKQMDAILGQYLFHAHSDTQWTNHLTQDRQRLKDYVKFVEGYLPNQPIVALPSSEWMNHVKSLLCKQTYVVYEDCSKIFFSYVNNFNKSNK